jgi:hypothetical protein
MKGDLWNVLAVSICEGLVAIALLVLGLVKLRTDPNYWFLTALVVLIAGLTYRRYRRNGLD